MPNINLGTATINIVANVNAFTTQFQVANSAIDNLGSKMRAFGRGLREFSYGLGLVGLGISKIFQGIVEDGKKLDTAVNNVKIYSDELRNLDNASVPVIQLRENIVALSEATTFSMQQVGEAVAAFIKAGVSLDDVFPKDGSLGLAALATQLAAFDDLTIGQAADAILTSVFALGKAEGDLTASARDVATTLATVANATNTSVLDLVGSLKSGGFAVNNAAIDFREAIAAFAIIGEAGSRGTAAGRQVTNLIKDFAKFKKAAIEAMVPLNLRPEDLNFFKGSNSLLTVIETLEDRLGGLEKKARGAVSLELANQVGARALGPLLQNYERFKRVVETALKTPIDLAKALEIRNQSVAASIGRLSTAFSGLRARLLTLIQADFSKLINNFRDFILRIEEFVKLNPELAASITKAIGVFGLFSVAMSATLLVIGTFIVSAGQLITAYETIRGSAAIAWLSTTALGTAFNALSAAVYAFAADPIAALIAGMQKLTAWVYAANTAFLSGFLATLRTVGAYIKSQFLFIIDALIKQLRALVLAYAIAFAQGGYLGVIAAIGEALLALAGSVTTLILTFTGYAAIIGLVIGAGFALIPVFKALYAVMKGFTDGFIRGFLDGIAPAIDYVMHVFTEMLRAVGVDMEELTKSAQRLGYAIGIVTGALSGLLAVMVSFVAGAVVGSLGKMFQYLAWALGWAGKEAHEYATGAEEAEKQAAKTERAVKSLALSLELAAALSEEAFNVKALENIDKAAKEGTVALVRLGRSAADAIAEMLDSNVEQRWKKDTDAIKRHLAEIEGAIAELEAFRAKMSPTDANIGQMDEAIAHLKDRFKEAQDAEAEFARRFIEDQQKMVDAFFLKRLDAELEAAKASKAPFEKIQELERKAFLERLQQDKKQAEERAKEDISNEEQRNNALSSIRQEYDAKLAAFEANQANKQKEHAEDVTNFKVRQQERLLKEQKKTIEAAKLEAEEIRRQAQKQVEALGLVGKEKEDQLALAEELAKKTIENAEAEVAAAAAREEKKTKKAAEQTTKRENIVKDVLHDQRNLEADITQELGKQARSVQDLVILFSFMEELEQRRTRNAYQASRRAFALDDRFRKEMEKMARQEAAGKNVDAQRAKVGKLARELALQIGVANRELGQAGLAPLQNLLAEVGKDFTNLGDYTAILEEAVRKAAEAAQMAAEKMWPFGTAVKDVARALASLDFNNVTGGFDGLIQRAGFAVTEIERIVAALSQLDFIVKNFDFDHLGDIFRGAGAPLNTPPVAAGPFLPSAPVGPVGGAPQNIARTMNDNRRITMDITTSRDVRELRRQVGMALFNGGIATEQI